MALDIGSLMGIAFYSSLKSAERDIVGNSLMLNILPGPPATKSAMSSMAIGMQARASIRRERRVAAATITAVGRVLRREADASAAFAAQPELKVLDPARLAQQFKATHDKLNAELPTDDKLMAELKTAKAELATAKKALTAAADMVVDAIAQAPGTLFTAAEAKKFNSFVSNLDDAQKKQIVR